MMNAQLKKIARQYGTPLYVYDEATIERQFRALDSAVLYRQKRIYYAAKANNNVALLDIIRRLGGYLDVSSPGEIFLGLKAGFKPSQLLFTGNNLLDEELKYALKKRIFINVDSLSQLERLGDLAPGTRVGVRLNPTVGAGHHDHVITASRESRFGVYYKEIGAIQRIAKKYSLTITGLHQHIGSGILSPSKFFPAVDVMLRVAQKFKDLEFIDLGGGLGIPYKPNEKPFDIEAYGKGLSARFDHFVKEYGRALTLYFEPGRYLVGPAGTLLMHATALKKNPRGDTIVGTNSGMTHLMRPALYGSYHEITNVSNPTGRRERVTVVGNICESTDVFTKNHPIAQVREGDLMAVHSTGAYGMAMSSRFNARLLPAEVLIMANGKTVIIRKRDTFQNLF